MKGWTSLVAQLVKNLPAMQETPVRFLGQEDPLQEGVATHSSILAWRTHEQRSLAGPSPWGHRELDMTERLSTAYFEMIPLLNQLLVAPLVLAQLLQT